MAIRVALHHRTTYTYARPASLGAHQIRLRPAPHNRTPIHRYSLSISPDPHFLNWQQDPHGNYVARVVFPEKVASFDVTVDIVADLESFNPFDFFLEPSAEHAPFVYTPELAEELRPHLEIDPPSPKLAAFVERVDLTRRRTVDFLVDVNTQVFEAVDYVIRMEPGVQTPEETLTKAKGSCRDSSWLLVQVLRHLGIAARFVSGYLIQLTADQESVSGPSGPESDFTDLHAWCEAYIPGGGWIGLDPTSGLLAAEGHIPLACSPKPSSAAPIEGALEKVETEFDFDMRVSRVVDRPRVTKPYSDEEWKAIVALGDEVDEQLVKADVRLSTGGEPTFVSSEHPDEPEWNIAALGGGKEAYADRLLRRLQRLWARGGILHHGQGKWYPGEQLPRWALSCYARKDGIPLWRDATLIAHSGKNYGHTEADAKRVALALTKQLGLARHGLMPAYEDTWYYLWREKSLPANVDPLRSQLEDALERERLAKVFDQGLNTIAGWVLPLAHQAGWQSGDWFLRRQQCFLSPGDSALGFRLPLDSTPWVARVEQQQFDPLDPSLRREPLPREFRFPLAPASRPGQPTQQRRRASFEKDRDALESAETSTSAGPFVAPGAQESALGLVKTAICFEARDGVVRVFLPPVAELEPFVELVAALEQAAKSTGVPVQLEGYAPPRDPRLLEFRVTPDPGVIEVNVPPTTSWSASVKQTEELYEAARQERLVAEKFELDGTHIGSGGGNHVVLGAETLNSSPFLRRPDVLGSLLRFWVNHPSLSYLFSGRFIGPTSQAPRVDEARHDSVYELELALKQLPKKGEDCPPWLVDRVLRNILVDVTGNTHRTEICIDKLFSPDGVSGRLGLLELRAFEMPPHERMSLVQQLLVRSLVSAFWEKPYAAELVKWGTSLHDRFMLPYYVMQDFEQVLSELDAQGYPFDKSWFLPHYEFRFPRYGELNLDALNLEVRGALEPWHVLGEESSAGGQSRYVDSSLERLQVKTSGLVPERYQVLCNGCSLPLKPTGTNGEFVSGVRYRAWQPPSALHPNIGTHDPVHIDIYDNWSRRNVAGCTYHVSHPGGRADEVRPVNAVAAESRRLARFEQRGHTGGTFEPKTAALHPNFPHTLDMRWMSVL